LDIAVELEEIHEAEADLYWGSSFDVELDEHEVLL
jgi:hypothetical protein